MNYSNSGLICHTKLSPFYNDRKGKRITKITPHHMAGNMSIEACGAMFANGSREVSSNYGIGTDGRIAMYVEEKNRAWTSSSPENDYQAITIEVANDGGEPDWHVSDKALNALIDLCVDICQRNDIDKLNFTGDKSGNLTMHKWFAATGCPGPYLESKFPYIAEEVNKRLNKNTTESNVKDTNDNTELYRVRKSWDNAGSQLGAFENLDNAKRMADKNTGYYVFNSKGKVIYPMVFENRVPDIDEGKSCYDLALEVIRGLWGNGVERKQRLTEAGYDYSTVQGCVNDILAGKDKSEGFKSYTVEVKIPNLNIRTGPGKEYSSIGKFTGKGIFTIVDQKRNWGKLKSGAGWICLDFATRVVDDKVNNHG